MRKIKFLAIFLCVSFNIIAQENISVPTPNAYSFVKNVDTPVSYFTGKPNISIPIWVVNEPGLEIPITLAYTPSGFKPNDHPGWVGDGFSLNVGGIISRKTKGKRDELFHIITTTHSGKLIKYGYFFKGVFSNVDRLNEMKEDWGFPYTISEFIDKDPFSFYWDGYGGKYSFVQDWEPDEYSFSFGAYSGKFIMGSGDNPGKPTVISNTNNIKVEILGFYEENYTNTAMRTNGSVLEPRSLYGKTFSFSGFRITTPDGTIYEFGCDGKNGLKNVDRSQNAFDYDGNPTTDAWHLSKIISPSGEELATFEYLQNEWGSNNEDLLAGRMNGLENIRQLTYSRAISYTNQPDPYVSVPINGRILHPCYLKKISTKLSEISFGISTTKELRYDTRDISNGYEYMYRNNPIFTDRISNRLNLTSDNYNWMQLDYINVREKGKEHTSDNTAKICAFYYTENDKERLRLLKFQNINKKYLHTNHQPPYLFSYHNKRNRFITGTEVDQPNRIENKDDYGTIQVDNFGFWTGKDAVLNFVSKYTGVGVTQSYPAGKPNDKRFYYGSSNPTHSISQLDEDALNDFEEQLENIGTQSGSNYHYVIDTIHYPTGGRDVFEYEPNFPDHVVAFNEDTSKYEVTNYSSSAFGIRIKNIKTYESSDNSKFKKREFSYNNSGILTNEVKNLLVYPVELTIEKGELSPNLFFEFRGDDVNEEIKIYSTNSFIPGSSNGSGSYIGFSKVTEKITDQDNNDFGKIEYYYRNYEDHPSAYPDVKTKEERTNLDVFENEVHGHSTGNHLPFYALPASSLSIDRGKMIAKKIYKADEEQPLVEEFFQYTKPEDSWDISFIQASYINVQRFSFEAYGRTGGPAGSNRGQEFITTHITASNYQYYYYPFYLSKKITKNYFEGSPLITEEETTYNYEYESNNVYVIETTTTNSKGEEIKNKYKYPRDFNYLNSVPFKMVNKNILNVPIETLTYVDGKIVSGTFTDYDAFPYEQNLNDITDNHQILPKKIYNLETSSPIAAADFTESTISSASIIQKDTRYQLTYNFDAYNSNGTLLQSHKENGVNVSYIWGYHNTKLIAKIINADKTTIDGILTEEDYIILEGSPTDTEINDIINKLRDEESLNNSQITSYTYNPLIGVTSITDLRGYTTYYEYDEFNRLKHVKDADGNILSKNQYNYKD